jgi:hypothetical protein
MPAGGAAVQFWHPVIHQYEIGLVQSVGLNGFQTGTDNSNNFLPTVTDHVRERSSEVALIVGD